MANNSKTHWLWEDAASMSMGVLIIVSPWLTQVPASPAIVINAVIVGLLILGLAGIESAAPAAPEEWLELVCGLWIASSPWLFGYAGNAQFAILQVASGLAVVALALLELKQDDNLHRLA